MKKTGFILWLSIGLILGLGRSDLFAEQTISESPEEIKTLGVFSTELLERYALMKDLRTEKQRLYGEGDILENGFKLLKIEAERIILQEENKAKDEVTIEKGESVDDLEFLKQLELNAVEYRYRVLGPDDEIDVDDFEVVDIKANKAILQRDYKVEPEPVYSEMLPTEEPVKVGLRKRRNRAILQASSPATSDSRLDKEVFSKIQTKQTAEDEWEVDKDSIGDAIVNTGKVLVSRFKQMKVEKFLKQGRPFSFTSAIGNATLNRSGLSVNTLPPAIREKTGWMKGDLIKDINGKSVRNLSELMRLYWRFSRNPPPVVKVNLIRNNKPKTLTYRIK